MGCAGGWYDGLAGVADGGAGGMYVGACGDGGWYDGLAGVTGGAGGP